MPSTATRTRRDRCPGVRRPWPAEDGALVRLRLVGGELSTGQLRSLGELSAAYGDGDVHVTGRANLQVRGLPMVSGTLPPMVVDAFAATGLLPSRTHELVRNLMVSPQSGWASGHDVHPAARALDVLLQGDVGLARLPGRFLFVFDDGRGDLVDRPCDLGLVALDGDRAQLRIGTYAGPVVPLDEAPEALADLARRFLAVRGDGPEAAWHVSELSRPLIAPEEWDPAVPSPSPAPAFGEVEGGTHVAVPDGVLTPALLHHLTQSDGPLRVTPWHGVLVPKEQP